ncbi:hypothetical protein DMA12_42525 [Amycolatopsis balhimycina DSM 5908]|uniref:Uncharacterized protein n=1 Tax=Amycolatopsis balhimycina DSM 5908 TaxID=1081091 RepID=A0A428VYI0_AMYBA|nr:hypothetical protein [Amycolatopsis balhimycina]RSM35875.1 hypothetical protein DMA12_42525 [Amycolatopsis balhimycina DSM 5908]
MEDIAETILLQLRRLSHDEQISSAPRLVEAIGTIRQRALSASGQVAEGGVVDDDVGAGATTGTPIGEI